jgi:hypothetical protein
MLSYLLIKIHEFNLYHCTAIYFTRPTAKSLLTLIKFLKKGLPAAAK